MHTMKNVPSMQTIAVNSTIIVMTCYTTDITGPINA